MPIRWWPFAHWLRGWWPFRHWLAADEAGVYSDDPDARTVFASDPHTDALARIIHEARAGGTSSGAQASAPHGVALARPPHDVATG